ncbi:MAG: glycosyltransferase [Pseudomonadota bacterium]
MTKGENWLGFYAPLKPTCHPVPSGDREVARLLLRLLAALAPCHELSQKRCFLRHDKQDMLDALHEQAVLERARLEMLFAQKGPPCAILTYHAYYKSPDLIAASLAQQYDIPYILCEASLRTLRPSGAWAQAQQRCLGAVQQAKTVLCMNPKDKDALTQVVPDHVLQDFPPIIDTSTYSAPLKISQTRQQLAARYKLDNTRPWIAVIAMMRMGAKLQSYEILAQCAHAIGKKAQFVIMGDGEARPQIQPLFGDNTRFLGQCDHPQLIKVLRASDCYAWPGVDEAYGLGYLEAQAAGLPVIAGNMPGTRAIINEGVSGYCIAPMDWQTHTQTLQNLLADKPLRQKMGLAARTHIMAEHSMEAGAARLRKALGFAMSG